MESEDPKVRMSLRRLLQRVRTHQPTIIPAASSLEVRSKVRSQRQAKPTKHQFRRRLQTLELALDISQSSRLKY